MVASAAARLERALTALGVDHDIKVYPGAGHGFNLAFRLRHVFGPGGRSEAMRVLLTCPDGSLDAARIARETGFAKRNISDVLTSLAASGAIRATRAGHERHFTTYRDRWALLLGLADPAVLPSFVSWVHLLPAALEITMWLEASPPRRLRAAQ